MSPSLLDPLLTSIAREVLPGARVSVRITEGGNRAVVLEVGDHRAEYGAILTTASRDPLRMALEVLIDGYFSSDAA